jgi:uncharacterized protein
MSNNLEVTIPSVYPLAGTLTIPTDTNGPFPAVLIIAGSGKGDRDGNIKKLPMNLYKDLADFLTEKGFVTLRYDKRGTYKSEGSFLEAGLSDLIDDAVQCVNFLKNHSQVDKEKIIVLGHSEGALIAPAVHKKSNVSGLILLAGAAEASKDLLPRQNEMAFKEMNEAKGLKGWLFRTLKVTEKARKQNEKIFQKVAETDQNILRVKGIKLNAKWLRETMEYNVLDYLEDVTCPVLAITGEKDLQVPPDHAKKIAESVKGEAEWHIIKDMNHMLRKYKGKHTVLGLIKEYKTQIGEPMDKELLEKIEDWLMKYYK